ncbi:[citrate (pro-3S)-lyase] ligase [Orbus wheelerorum]|uniref:[citrate (pro-3S)-lyase] ligase n=1 Tax=Orbus wheelerorum TaxID=3074111 RepID=UPI00370DA1EB
MNTNIKFAILDNSAKSLNDVKNLLELCNLQLDSNIDLFVVAYANKNQIIASAGLYHNIIKCVAIDPKYRGENLSNQLLNEIINYAADKGIFHLFLYTKPENIRIFNECGFYPLVVVPDLATLMENTPVGIAHYCKELSNNQHSGKKIGSIVMNANPFTLGHQYLVEFAAKECDWLYIFVVSEENSLFSFKDRFNLVQAGTAKIANVSVLSSSEYIVSQATFPNYFLKEKADIEHANTGIDLLLFRNYIAPSLNITHRFVGTEPFSPITNKYNQGMKYWLNQYQTMTPKIDLIEIERKHTNGVAISATAVRRLLNENKINEIKELVPETTWNFLQNNYVKNTERYYENR